MTTTTLSPATATPAVTPAMADMRAICAAVFMLGAGLVFMVGFAHSSVMHNAAHDTRHSLAFPCH